MRSIAVQNIFSGDGARIAALSSARLLGMFLRMERHEAGKSTIIALRTPSS